MYESEERHEYNTEEVRRIVKKKDKKTREEADVAQAINEAQGILPRGQTLKVVTETYHHYEHQTLNEKADTQQKRRKPKAENPETSEERLHLGKQRGQNRRKKSGGKDDRQDYSQGQISLIVKKSRKTSDEEQIAAAILEARQLAPSGKPVKVITVNYPPVETGSAKPRRNQVVPVGDVVSQAEDKDKAYKEIFDYKLLPPLGFYRRGDRYLAIRKRYERADDGRGVGMTDKYWNRQKNFTFRNLFAWPPIFCFRRLFWSFGYYDDVYEKAHRVKSETDPKGKQKKSDNGEFDSDDDRFKEYDDEGYELTINETRRTSSSPWGAQMNTLTEQQLKEFKAKTRDITKENMGDLYSVLTQEEFYQFENKEMLMYPWELDMQTIRKLNRRQLEDYNEVCDFCNSFVSHEDKKLNYIRTHMGQNEFKEFIVGRDRAKAKFVADLRTLAHKNRKILQEATEMSKGPWEGSDLKSLLILEYGMDLVNYMGLGVPQEAKDNEAGERKKKRSTNDQPTRNVDKNKKAINWKVEDDRKVSTEADDNADNNEQKNALPPVKVQNQDEYLEKRKSKTVELKPRMEGEGERLTLGKIRRGTKHNPNADKIEYDEDEEEEDDEAKKIKILPGLNKEASVAFIRRYSVSRIEKNKFTTSRLKWTNAREPKAKEAELWNSLPKNPKLHNETMLLACLPQNASASDLKELFPTGKITIENPGNNVPPYATIKFPSYEACRTAYDRVRNVTYDGQGLVAIPRSINNSEEELQTFLRNCK